MKGDIDCFLIGHNEMSISAQIKLFKHNYGKSSKNYRERSKYNLAHVKYHGNVYSISDAFHELCGQTNDNLVMFPAFSLTIAYLGSYLANRGISIGYIDSFNIGKKILIENLCEKRIKIVAITTTYYLSALPITDIVKTIREYSTETIIIIGGPFILNQVRDLDAHKLQNLLKSLGADVYVSSRQGEASLYEVIEAIKKDRSIYNIPNIFYMENGEYVYTKTNEEQNDIDANRVRWELFQEDIPNNVNTRTSVSCPFSCEFCSFPKSAGKYKSASMETIEHELDVLYSLGKVKGFSIIDDTLNFPPQRFKSILKMMIKKGYGFKWSCFLRCEHVDREMIELMKESGCIQVFCGIESGSQIILNNLNKRTSVSSYQKGFSLLNEYDITSVASIFVGFPGETCITYKETCDLIEDVKPTFIQPRLWWYDHNAPIYEKRLEHNLKGNGYEWSHNTMDSSTALELVDNLILSTQNSIHLTEYPIPFNMMVNGYHIEKVKQFIKSFSMCIREGIEKPDYTENSEELVQNLCNSMK